MGWVFKRDESDVQSEVFVNLMRAAQQDAGIKARLVSVFSLEAKNRIAALNALLLELKQKNIAIDPVGSMTLFLDERVVQKALAQLRG